MSMCMCVYVHACVCVCVNAKEKWNNNTRKRKKNWRTLLRVCDPFIVRVRSEGREFVDTSCVKRGWWWWLTLQYARKLQNHGRRPCGVDAWNAGLQTRSIYKRVLTNSYRYTYNALRCFRLSYVLFV